MGCRAVVRVGRWGGWCCGRPLVVPASARWCGRGRPRGRPGRRGARWPLSPLPRARMRAWDDEGMRIAGVESTDLFTGSTTTPAGSGAAPGARVQAGRPLQVVRVTVEATEAAEAGATARVRVMGSGAETPAPFVMTLGEPGE